MSSPSRDYNFCPDSSLDYSLDFGHSNSQLARAQNNNSGPNIGFDHRMRNLDTSNYSGYQMHERYNDTARLFRSLESMLGDVLHQNEKLRRQVTQLESVVEESFLKLSGSFRSFQTTVLDALKTLSPVEPHLAPQAPSTATFDMFDAMNLTIPCLDSDDYPDCKYWKKEDFVNEKNTRVGYTKHDSGSSNNTMTWYVTDEDGDPVNKDKVEQIRADARALWSLLRDKGQAPQKWTDANLATRTFYEHHICKRHPELSYCENNWKAFQICTDNYPSWSGTHLPEKAKAKLGSKKNAKRSSSPTGTSQLKKKARVISEAPFNKAPKASTQIRDPLHEGFNFLSFYDIKIGSTSAASAFHYTTAFKLVNGLLGRRRLRSICKREWAANYPDANEDAWRVYWETISNDSAAYQKYKDLAQAASNM
ncbi:hypothetical protein C0991_001957, partial [Blastosporella zonata]